ncbi:MAG TPA: response regulator [Burkholderiaceae bacterium]|jgi:CheY-like chemotaxis protein
MSRRTAASRVLVASDSTDDAQQIVRQLEAVFDTVHATTVAADAGADFERCKPDVLVLGMDTLDKAQRYYLGLYRLSAGPVPPHRTVLLCRKDEVSAAYELCTQDYFDDYVLYWPQSFDGKRLAMSVWNACRSAGAAQAAALGPTSLAAHARHLAQLERVVADDTETSLTALRERIEPALAGTRPLAAAIRTLRPRVMVVEDDELARRIAAQALDPERWEVSFAKDATDALLRLRRVRPDVILMDVRMPDLDGVEFTRRLKATPELADIPIVMMTGDARRETLMSSMQAGAIAFVVKPLSRSALEAKLAPLFGP